METEWNEIITWAVREKISDLHLTAGQNLFYRVGNRILPRKDLLLTHEFLKRTWELMLTEKQRIQLEKEHALDFSWNESGRRIRGNAYYQRGEPALALRLIPEIIPSLGELGASPALAGLLQISQGFLLVTGRTGSGKSTTLAAFLKLLMRERSIHLLTLEDPIEYLHHSESSFISQRELGRDFPSFPQALKHALREMPDIILVGEIRDSETMQLALEAASTGIFVLGTLHTKSASETAMRVESLFPLHQRDASRDRCAEVFTGIFSQSLLPSLSGGRVCATEVLLATPASRNLIRMGKYNQIQTVMKSSPGMNTMEDAVKELYRDHMISQEVLNRYLNTCP